MIPAITVRGLGFVYPDGRSALDDVSFSIAPAECVGLIGPNGAGKSTLLQHLNGILPDPPPTEPRVWIDNLPVTATNLPAVRRAVGFLFQDTDDQLFCPTVAEDVAFGPQQFGLPPQTVRERVAAALERVGLPGFDDRLPHHLSAGERRRVCLAGVLACEPSVLVLDEPTSDLDPRGRRELESLLRSLATTRLIATHDLELVVRLCDRALLLDDGRLVAEGRPVDLLNDGDLMLRHGLERPHILQHRHPH